ncbi:hypothetical protein HYV82_03450 [Candidatus Woesearchaeota archaeon]|nr:hypothetical protein [Candidatus Woesearchaeota archaeon]
MVRTRRIIDVQDLILGRLSSSYEETLQTFGITEEKYFRAVQTELERARSRANLGWGSELERAVIGATAAYVPPDWVKEIANNWFEGHNDTISRLEQVLFRIEPDYLINSFKERLDGRRKKLPRGALQSPHNIETWIVNCLENAIPGLKWAPRYKKVGLLEKNAVKKRVIEAEGKAQAYLHSLGMETLMIAGLGGSLRNSPLAVLRIYDGYLRRLGFASLFDLEQRRHMHWWDLSPQGYLQKLGNIEEVVTHTLEENIPGLRQADRETAISLFEKHVVKAEGGAERYLHSLGLKTVMNAGVGGRLNGSPHELVRVYDTARVKSDGWVSMFDQGELAYLTTQRTRFGNEQLTVVKRAA